MPLQNIEDVARKLTEALPEVLEADERISQAMLDNTSTAIVDIGFGGQSARTMVLCQYDDLRIVLGFLDEVRAHLTKEKNDGTS